MDIEAYLNQLCSALETDPLGRDEIGMEVHSHLRSRAEALIKTGTSPASAETTAMEEFGAPQAVAERFNRTGALNARSSVQTRTRLGSAMIVLGVVILIHLVVFQSAIYKANMSPEDTQLQVTYVRALMAVTFFYFLFGAGFLTHRRWVRLPTVLLLAPNLIPFSYLCFRLMSFDLNMYPGVITLFFVLGVTSLYLLRLLFHPRHFRVQWLEG